MAFELELWMTPGVDGSAPRVRWGADEQDAPGDRLLCIEFDDSKILDALRAREDHPGAPTREEQARLLTFVSYSEGFDGDPDYGDVDPPLTDPERAAIALAAVEAMWERHEAEDERRHEMRMEGR